MIRPRTAFALLASAVAIVAVTLAPSRPTAEATSPPSSVPWFSETVATHTFPGGESMWVEADWFVPSMNGHLITIWFDLDPLGAGLPVSRSFIMAAPMPQGEWPQDNPSYPFVQTPVEEKPFDNEAFWDFQNQRLNLALEFALLAHNTEQAWASQFPQPEICEALWEDVVRRDAWFRIFGEFVPYRPGPALLQPCEVFDGSCPDMMVMFVQDTLVPCTPPAVGTVDLTAPPPAGQNQHPYSPLYTQPSFDPYDFITPLNPNLVPDHFLLPSEMHPRHRIPTWHLPYWGNQPIN